MNTARAWSAPNSTSSPTSGSSVATSRTTQSCRAASASTRCGRWSASTSGWIGGEGHGRALGLGELKLAGQVLPNVRKIVYNIDIKRVMRSKLVLGIADGWLSMDGEIIYRAKDLKVGLFKQGTEPA